MFDVIYLVLLGALGLVFGSFANVVIHRFPRGESVVRPRSRCPECGHEIRWYDNLPVLSWILLHARCRDCGAPISVRYPVVEGLGGVLWVTAASRFGFGVETVVAIIFLHLLLILAFIDLDTMRLPNVLVLALFCLGLAAALLSQWTEVAAAPLVGLGESGTLAEPVVMAAAGVFLGVGPSLLIALVYGALRGRAGLGMGDVKLLGAMGPFLGPYVLLAFFGGSVLGTFVSVPIIARAKRAGKRGVGAEMIPFGPFLALAGALSVLFGPAIVDWYLAFVGL